MALVLKDRVKVTSTTTGTGTLTLSGAATGYQSFAAIGDGNTTYYAITDPATGDWEVGIGTYTSSGTTLSRATILSSSNAGSVVDLQAGTKEVFCVYPAEKAVYEEANGETLIDGGPITVIGSGVTSIPSLPAELGKFIGNIDSFAQIYLLNQSTGTTASSDFVAYNDDTTDGDNFFTDMGINGSNYTSIDYPIFTPNSGYIFHDGDHFFIGNQTANKDIVLFAGGADTTDEAVRISGTDRSVTTDADLTVGGALDITGAATFGSTVLLDANPTTALQAATKQYVDNQVTAGLHIHEPARVETTANLNATYVQGGTTFNITDITGTDTVTTSTTHGLSVNDQIWLTTTAGNGLSTNTAYFVFSVPASNQLTLSLTFDGTEITGLTNASGLTYATRANSGVGATLTNAGTQAALNVDSIALSVSNRVMVRLQTNGAENGVYTVTTVGDGSTNWVLTRATDANIVNPGDPDGLGTGDYFFTTEGALNAGDSHVLTTEPNTMIIGYTTLTYTQFSGGIVYTGTAPINVTGQVISLTGTVAATNGGTGVNTVTTGDLLYGSATNTWSKLPIGSGYKSLIVNAGGTQVEWNAVALDQSAAVSGSLGATNGGTGQTTYTTGDILYSSATNTLAKLAGNTTITPKYLRQVGTGAVSQAPTWETLDAGDVTSGTLAVARGGTNLGSYTTGDLIYASGTTTLAALADIATGNVLLSGGAGVAPSYGKVVFGTHTSGINSVSEGGTGVATLTGLAYGNGTAAFSAATASEVVAVIGTTAVTNATNATNATTAASCSGNAATATVLETARNINGTSFNGSADITVTANTTNTLTRGTYLTGNNFNGSAATTWAVDATDANTVSKVVARDGSGNFAAGTITATLSGNATTATTATTANATAAALTAGTFLTSGGTFNGSTARTFAVDATSANTVSKVVARDASGNFSAGTITAALTGNVTGNVTGSSGSCTGNSATATTATNQSGGTVSATTGSFSGLVTGATATTADINAANDTGSFSCRGNASFPASMSFHRTGVYAINMGLSTSNNFIIGGWSASSNAFSMTGAGALTMLNNITAYSDERVKTNWRDLQPDFIEQLAKVKHGIYDRTDQVSTQIGVGAQSLRPVMEHAVMEDENGNLSVAYGNAALVAVIELAKQVVELKKEIELLKAK
jgi:hypothetical protein